MMSLESFKEAAKIIPDEEAIALRERYIHCFIDTKHEWYVKHIQVKRKYPDGEFYSAYLWDCLQRPYTIIEFDELKRQLSLRQIVMVMWDIHSSYKIRIPNYWNFGKNAVIQLSPNNLIRGFQYLPEDIYIFDNSFTWSLVATHEYNNADRILVSINREAKNT